MSHADSQTEFEEPDSPPQGSREAMHPMGRDELLVVVKGEVTVIMPKPADFSAALSGAGTGVYNGHEVSEKRANVNKQVPLNG